MEPVPILLMSLALGSGGSERQLCETALHLDRNLFEPHVGCFRASGVRFEELQRGGVPILHLPVTSWASVNAVRGLRALRSYIHQHKIQLVHTFDYVLTMYAIPAVRIATKAVAVSSQRSHRELIPGFSRTVVRATDSLAHGIVVNCRFVENHLRQDYNVAPGKIHLCYNGIDLDRFCKEGLSARGRELPSETFVVGVTCSLRPEKGLLTLVDGFAAVRRPGATKLVIVGSGPMRDPILERVRERGIAGDCVLVPESDDISYWLRAMDVFVLPSLSEALSNSLMEAMACGCCVIASNVGGNPELAGENRGMLFEAASAASLETALRTVMRDPEIRAAVAFRGMQFLRNGFSVERAASRMGEIYTTLLTAK